MSRSTDRRNAQTYDVRKLVGQYFAQRVPESSFAAMAGCCAVTFRPGGYTSSFAERSILPVGAATMFQLGYVLKACRDGQQRLEVPLLAANSCAEPDGSPSYNLANCRLRKDVSRRPFAGAGGQVIDPERNPSLLETALRMDKACQRAVAERRRLQKCLLMPRLLLGFPEDRVPEYQDTVALRELAAEQLDVPLEHLGSNGEVLLDRLLRETWERSLILLGAPHNWTGSVLIDAQLCPNARRFMRSYQDFRQLLGVPTWNPVRDLRVQRFANPARQVLVALGLGERPDFNQPLSDELIGEMLCRMRLCVGDQAGAFSDEDILDGITQSDAALVAWSMEIPKLRARLAVFANECCTDDDLKAAALQPDRPLWLRFACRIQVVKSSAALVQQSAPDESQSQATPSARNVTEEESIDLRIAS